jgi:HSF-type DNA-binding
MTKSKIPKQLSFPTRLWQLANADHNHVLQWNRGGETFLVHADGLDEHLNGAETLFSDLKDSATFFRTLEEFGFMRIPPIPESPDALDCSAYANTREYFHNHFNANAQCLLNVIAKPRHCVAYPLGKHMRRMSGDPCQRLIRFETNMLDWTRLHMKLTLEMNYVSGQLAKTMSTLDRNKQANVIEIPHRYFDEPLTTEQPEYAINREIAGNYGHVPSDMLKSVFGDFLPLFADKLDEDMDISGGSSVVNCENESLMFGFSFVNSFRRPRH